MSKGWDVDISPIPMSPGDVGHVKVWGHPPVTPPPVIYVRLRYTTSGGSTVTVSKTVVPPDICEMDFSIGPDAVGTWEIIIEMQETAERDRYDGEFQ